MMWVTVVPLSRFLFGVKEGLKTKCRFPHPQICVSCHCITSVLRLLALPEPPV